MAVNSGLSSALIKSPNTSETYTEYELEELTKCMDPESGVLYFAENYAYIQHPVHGKLKFEPYKYQERVLQYFNQYGHVITMQPRQSGKCSSYQTLIKLRNKHTGEILETSIGDFFKSVEENTKQKGTNK